MATIPAPEIKNRSLNFTPLQVGVVGTKPTLWFIKTELTNAELQTTGILNNVNPRPETGDFVLAYASDGSRYYVVVASESLVLTGNGGGSVTDIMTGHGLTGGPITTVGTISLAQVDAGTVMANIGDFPSAPAPVSPSALFDNAFTDVQGSILYRDTTQWTFLSPGTLGQFLASGGPGADVSWETGIGGFNPQYTIYFAIGGDDGNPGTQQEPLATLEQAVSNANDLINDGAAFVSIIGLGIGIDTSNLFFTKGGIDIYAPGFQLNPVTGDALTVDLSGGSIGSYINILLASSAVEPGAKVLNLLSVTPGEDNVTNFNFIGITTGDVYLTTKCVFTSTLIAGVLTALEAGTKVTTLYGIGAQSAQSRLNLQGITYGNSASAIHGPVSATNNWRYPMFQFVELTGDYTLLISDSGYVFKNSTTGPIVITLPEEANQGTPVFNDGYFARFLNASTGSISFAVEGTDVLNGPTSLTTEGQMGLALKQEPGIWVSTASSSGSGGGASSTTWDIPWTCWNYFVWANGNQAWSPSTTQNGSPYDGTSKSFGTFDFIAPADGTYRFTVNRLLESNQGILTVTINAVATAIDNYNGGGDERSYVWEQALTAGTYPIEIDNLTKNPSSSDYNLLLKTPGIQIAYMGP